MMESTSSDPPTAAGTSASEPESETSSSARPALAHTESDPLTTGLASMPGELNAPPQVSDVGEDDEDDGIIIDGFAIDSDEDDDMPSNPFRDGVHEEVDLGGGGSSSGGAAGAAADTAAAGGGVAAGAGAGDGDMDHPLNFFGATDATAAPAAGATNSTAAAAAAPLQTPAKRDLASGGLHGGGFLGLRSSSAAAAAGSSFSSGGAFLSSFAQKAAHSLQEAAEGATKAVKVAGDQMAAQAAVQQQQQPGMPPPLPGQQQPRGAPQQNPAQVQPQPPQPAQIQPAQPPPPQQQQPQPQQLPQAPPGLDNNQKSALITSALSRSGGLLPGERVVVFLSPLSGVRDSSWNSSLVGSHDLDPEAAGAAAAGEEVPKWCCAVTFYRVVVFSYLESEFPPEKEAVGAEPSVAAGDEDKTTESAANDAAADEKGESVVAAAEADPATAVSIAVEKGQEGNNAKRDDASLDPVLIASVSRRYQSLRTRRLGRPKSHHVFELPLASLERVERTTEYPPVQAYGSSGGGGGGVGSAVVSGMAGGLGNVAGGVAGFMSGGAQMMNAANSNYAVQQQAQQGGAAHVGLLLYSKHNSSWLRFAAPTYGDATRAHEVLNTYAFPGRRNLGYLFAFESRRVEVMASVQKVEGVEQGAQNGQQQQRVTSRATPRRYDALKEYGRMGVMDHGGPATAPTDAAAAAGAPAAQVRSHPSPWSPLLHSNATYGLCPSYPSVLFGPAAVNDAHPDGLRLIRKVAAFRSEGRMPALSWSSCVDGASLWRSSQPRVGLQGNRSAADERYLRLIGEGAANAHAASLTAAATARCAPLPSMAFLRMLTGGANEEDLLGPQRALRRVEEAAAVACAGGNSNGVNAAAAAHGRCLLKILDLRPKTSAVANRTQGYGYENTSYYPNSTLSFCGIGNIHAVRDAYQKMSALCLSPSADDNKWSSLIEDTKWLNQVRLILSVSWQAAFHVRYNRLPVLLHCSHGWDRTSQVSALAQLFLDPYYRTREGFATLVEKEFMALGHPFHTRCGHGEGRRGESGGDRPGSRGGGPGKGGSSSGGGGGGDDNQLSPIFMQFIDCAYQVVRQYPDYFEFNERYLLLLSEHVYSCRFGTLLCDTERERETVAGIRQRTHCLWEYLDARPDVVNTSFVPRTFTSRANEEEDGALMMPLPTLLRNVVLWTDRHCAFGPKATSRCIPGDLDDVLREGEPTAAAEPEDAADGGDNSGATPSLLPEPPLLSSTDVDRARLLRAEAEAAKWKEVAESRLAELEDARRQLEDLRG